MFLINRVPKAVGQGGRPSQPHCHFLTMTTGSSKQSFMALFSHEIINCPEKGGGGGLERWREGERMEVLPSDRNLDRPEKENKTIEPWTS